MSDEISEGDLDAMNYDYSDIDDEEEPNCYGDYSPGTEICDWCQFSGDCERSSR